MIKVCGMRDADNIQAVEQLGIDWMGMIFWPKSSRFVTDVPSYLPKQVRRVGVFVDASLEDIRQHVSDYQLDLIQLHGKETPAFAEALKPLSVIKAFNIADAEDLKQTKAYEGIVDYFLFDTKGKVVGGNGEKFDWSVLSSYHGETPFLLSGGIGPDDVEAIKSFRHPKCIGIDLNSRFEQAPALKAQDRKLLSLYFCAGCPTFESTTDIILATQRRGIDMLEVGIPFSDPLADGPVIQSAATQALRNGMSLKKLFEQLKSIKDDVKMPLVLMGYLNPILHYGIEAFCQSCAESGVSGAIIPDLPFKDYLDIVKPVADRYDLRIIMLITPETSEERVRFIDEHTDGFIYMVSSAAITGAQKSFDDAKQAYFRRINAMQLRNPRMIGFGISNQQTLQAAQQNAAGAIIGSKFVTLLNESKDADEALDKLFDALSR